MAFKMKKKEERNYRKKEKFIVMGNEQNKL